MKMKMKSSEIRMWLAYQVAKLYQLCATGHFRDYVSIPTSNVGNGFLDVLHRLARKIDPVKVKDDEISPAMLLGMKDRVHPELTTEEFFDWIRKEIKGGKK